MKYNKQQGSALAISLVVMCVVILAIGAALVLTYVSSYKYGNKMEKELISIRDNNKNIYAQGTQTVMEIAQVPKMYAEDLKSAITADVQGKFGKDGSKATMQWFKDRNISLDASLYKEITQAIKAFRSKFEANQTRMIDVKRQYTTVLDNDYIFGQGWWLHFAGYPKVDLNQFNPITTDLTEKVFTEGKEHGPLQLR